MKDATSRSPRLSVLIDADNANPNLIDSLLKEISKYGTPQVLHDSLKGKEKGQIC